MRGLRHRLGAKPALLPTRAEAPADPCVSVVLGSYNRLALLQAAIESVRENGITVPYEIIVVDGGSTDGTIEWLVQQKDIVTIVQHNRGEFRGRQLRRRSWGYFMNLAFKATQGRWVLMISDDCVLLPGAVMASLARADVMTAEGQRIGGVAYYFRNWPSEGQYYVQQTLGARLMVNHGLFAREALESVGFIDEDSYAFYKADGDLNLRIWDAGFQIIDSPQSIVEHYMDDAEAVRQSNNAVLDADRDAYNRRWGHLSGSPARTVLEGVVPTGVAERIFGPIRAGGERR